MSIDSQQSFHSLVIIKGPEEDLAWHQDAVRLLKALNVELHSYVVDSEQMFHHTSQGLELDPKTMRLLKSSPLIWKSSVLHKEPKIDRQLHSLLSSEMEIFAHILHTRSYDPFLPTSFPGVDLVLIFEGTDYPYSYQEYFSSEDVVKSVHYHHRSHMQKLIQFSFDFARHFHRKKISCVSHKNRQYLSETFFHHLFTMIGASYPEIENSQMSFEEALLPIFSHPEDYDTLLMPREYGLLFQEGLSQIIGKKCLSSEIEIGEHRSLFTYESSIMKAKEKIANPSSHWILSLIHLLYFMGDDENALTLSNSWLKTLEEGIHPLELYDEKHSIGKYSGGAFVDEMIQRLGKVPVHFAPIKPIIPSQPLVHPAVYEEKGGHLGVWDSTVFTIRCPELRELFLSRLFALSFDSILIEKIVCGGKLIYPTEENSPSSQNLYQVFFMKIHSTGAWEDQSLFQLWKLLLSQDWEILDVTKIFSYTYDQSLNRGELKAL